ncbi:DNRLRE domain-containing protein [candidate division WOR-3 bacterium]|uniref:DNRLRE domain-containing protein n=1 Tax=candidate division WOR-3 bacterium TaxID=2052148 RepID=A0A9D5KAT9_UNCW3|nr:DNRLRE domain-containing protein [candidate division WOR-3 bacterium]MBD3365677.1 DNRLRE domain-containing protein [candidate division WOR-3 bacterium]
MNRWFSVLLLIFSVLFVTGCNPERTVTLQPGGLEGKDTYVWSDNLQANFGDTDSLPVGERGSAENRECYTLIEFTGLSEYDGVEVLSANLELYCNNSNTAEASIFVSPITESWDEPTVRWYSQPQEDAESAVSVSWPENASWWSVDVTGIVTSWLDGTRDNFGFMIYCDTSETTVEDDWTSFYSSDYEDDEALWPKLTLEYKD